jgi:hypothetical protein
LVGVTNATLSLSQVSDFLQNLKIGRSGQTFIMERSGDLVACSSLHQPLILNKDGAKEKWRRLQASDSNNRLTRLTAQYLIKHFGNLHRIMAASRLTSNWQQAAIRTSDTLC